MSPFKNCEIKLLWKFTTNYKVLCVDAYPQHNVHKALHLESHWILWLVESRYIEKKLRDIFIDVFVQLCGCFYDQVGSSMSGLFSCFCGVEGIFY